jgi:hypothetical protein
MLRHNRRMDRDTEPAFRQWLIGLIAIGAIARLARYALRFPLWEDECFLCINLADRDYAQLLEPMQFYQVAPVPFIWLQKATINLLGFNEWTLRLWPIIASLASLWLYVWLTGRLLTGKARLFAVGLFAVAYPCIRYASEAKQYGFDLLMSLVLLSLFTLWLQSGRVRWMWLLACAMPLIIGLSFPSVFVAGAVMLAAIVVMWRKRGPAHWAAWAATGATLLIAFGAFLAIAMQAQSEEGRQLMEKFWAREFPPWRQPLQLAIWFIDTHTNGLMAYPIGGERGASTLTTIAFVTGVVALFRRKRVVLLWLCLTPFVLHMIAAFAQRFPYGGHPKFSMYLAPIICLVAGQGVALLPKRPRGVVIISLLLGAIAVGSIARDVTHPYKAPSDQHARQLARTLWPDLAQRGEVMCMHRDLGINFSPKTFTDLNWSAQYLCNQVIYRPAEDNPDTGLLQIVQYRDEKQPYDQPAFEAWLSEMQRQRPLIEHTEHQLPRYDKRMRHQITMQVIDVYTFGPPHEP